MGRRHYRFLKSEQLESRRPLAADLAALDINNDMSVTALDALLIINTINQRATTTNTVSTAEAEAQLECDTNGDGVVTPIDVLNVVNQINSGIIAVPTDSTDTTTGSDGTDTGTVPTDSGDTPLVDSDPGDDVTTSPDDNSTDDTTTDDSDSDTSDPVDETDGTDTDDDVVNDPTDGTDDSTDDDTSDDTNDDDTSTQDPECEHHHAAAETGRSLLIGHGHHGRGDLFAALDANGDGALSSDEVPAAIWDTLVDADTDSSNSVTKAELTAYKEAQRVAAVEAFFKQLDKDGSGSITSADVSRIAWRFLSRADANDDGGITVDELLAVPVPGRWGAH